MKTLNIYMYGKNWVFDEPGICEKEPFVMGSTDIITRVAVDNGIKNPEKRILSIHYDDNPIPDYDCKMEWESAESNGNWYYCKEKDMRGWLCPMLLYYFKEPPKEIYFKIEDGGVAPEIEYKESEKFSIADVALEREDGTVLSWDDIEEDEIEIKEKGMKYLDDEFAEVQSFLEDK